MEKRIRERYNDAILDEARGRYDIAPEQITLLDGFESFIYEFRRDGRPFILRVGHSLRNSPSWVLGEADWINYLVDGGVTAARAVPSAGDNLVESIDDGQDGAFLATAFVKAPGLPVWRTEAGWSPALYETYGRLIGRMHALARGYVPRDPAASRPRWDSPRISGATFVSDILPASERVILDKYRALYDYVKQLPESPDAFGLIHCDAHAGNFFVDEAGTITLFDFDDCHYGWFINDIAMVLFYMVINDADPPGLTAAFMPHFLRGYRQEHRLDPSWLPEIAPFLKGREIELYAVIHRSLDVEDLSSNPWIEAFMKDRKALIEAGAPTVDFDFASLAPYLDGD